MKLADLRRTSVRKNVRIRFQLPNGMECVVNEHGMAKVPALCTIPDFDLEGQVALVREFTVESVTVPDRGAPRLQVLSPEQLAAVTGAPRPERHEDHEE